MIRIAVDLNVRVQGHRTYAGFEDVVGAANADHLVAVGDKVLAWEPEDDIVTDATVCAVDEATRIIYLDVDWYAFRDASTGQSGSS